ncbi:MAG: transposase (plasmid) [Candidatus Symbiodolus clandestinus]
MNSPHKVVDNSRKTPPYYSDEFKQRLVAASHQPGDSLSSVARESGVSTSALFRWRK